MNQMDTINYLLLFVAIANTILAMAILRRSRKLDNAFYAFAIFTVVGWVITMILYRAASQEVVLVYCRWLYFVATITASTFLFFSTVFPNKKITWWAIPLIFVPNIVIAYVTLATDLVIQKVTLVFGEENIIDFGSYYNIYSTYVSLSFTVGFIVLGYRYFHTSGVYREQVKYVFLGYFIAANAAMTTNLIMPYYFSNFSLNWIGQFFSLIMVGFTTYAIVKYRLLNLRLVLTRSVVYLVLIVMVATMFVFGSTSVATYLNEIGVNQYIVWIVISVCIVVGLDPVKKVFASMTDKIFYKNIINYGQELKILSSLINAELELESLVIHFHKELDKRVKIRHSDVYLDYKRRRAYISLRSEFNNLHAKPLEDNRMRRENELIRFMEKGSSIAVRDELERRAYDSQDVAVSAELHGVIKKMQELDISIAVPLRKENYLVGLLTVGPKNSGEAFTTEDINLLEVLAPQLAAALERSKLYQEVHDFNFKLTNEVKKATKDLKIANAHLKDLDVAKSEFMSIASHQLRTPLAGMMGYLSMILAGDYGRVTKPQTEVLSEMLTAGQRLTRLVNSFLNATRIEAGRLTINYSKIPFDELIHSVVMELMPTAQKKQVTLTYKRSKLPVVEVDPDKIKDVVLNLIDNAIKYSPGGTITVSAKTSDNGMIRFISKDTGVGLPKNEAKGLFEKFVRGSGIARVEPNGSGLGLFIAKKIIEAHSGKIWAESEGEGEGEGSTFQFEVPIKKRIVAESTHAQTATLAPTQVDTPTRIRKKDRPEKITQKTRKKKAKR